MSDQPNEPTTDLDELNPEGAGAGVTEGEPTTFEPEEPEHPADDK